MGDQVYGPHFKTKANQLGPESQAALAALGRQALHAYLLVLEHPRTGEILRWEQPLPEDLVLLEGLPESGAMTQAFLKSLDIPKAYGSHTVT